MQNPAEVSPRWLPATLIPVRQLTASAHGIAVTATAAAAAAAAGCLSARLPAWLA
jgi:hypothetical protein